MRAYLPAYELVTPSDLHEALGMLEREPGAWKVFAGGTDLMVSLAAGHLPAGKFINLWNFAELKTIREDPDHITLGALTTYTQVQENRTLQSEFPMLCQAAFETGGIAIQNRGTLGGNIANASPAADSCPPLLAYDAELELVSARGARRVPYRNFHTGYKATLMHPDELIAQIRLPRLNSPAWRHYFRKVGTRRAQAISKVCLSARARVQSGRIEEICIALGSIAPTVIRCPSTESTLTGSTIDRGMIDQARQVLAREISPINDMRSTARYRTRVAGNLLQEFLEGLIPE
ncbi:MAG TPA: FAD binding domain-containing protein [Acidobacteriota bacterium]|jgi:CO/xanthine dehydrogenase FAD-binding subunit